MQSTEPKAKRTRKEPAESAANAAQATAAGTEEATKPRRKSTTSKTTMEPTPAAKQHRPLSKKLSEPVTTQSSVQSSGSQPLGGVSQELPVRLSRTATHDKIAVLAYSYWAERGRQHGFHEEDWFRAERTLRS